MIPEIDVTDVLQNLADNDILAGAESSGFLTLTGVDQALGLSPARETMLSFFDSEPARQATIRQKFDPARTNVYRGFFPCDPTLNILLEGIDLGPDISDPARAGDGADPLTEATPRPGLKGWDAAAATYFAAMEEIGLALTRALLRGLGSDPALADHYFTGSISTLRLLHYLTHDAEVFGPKRRVIVDGREQLLMTGAHTDSGFVTLLWQDGTGGLQAESPDGWIDVPPNEGGLVVNFGQMLGDWTGGRIKATRHRVLGGTAERFSIPFFFEPAVDARIAPLTGDGPAFVYGDFLWDRMQAFPNMKGLVRKPAA